MTDLYPEAPHLSAFVAPGLHQSAALLGAWSVLSGLGCVFDGEVLLARDDERFRDVSDVVRDVVGYRGLLQDVLVDPRFLRVKLRHEKWGMVSLGLSSVAEFGDTHPLEVTVHAGPMSLPSELWSRQDHQEAKRLESWMERILLALATATDALYGAIGIESIFPTPGAMALRPPPALRPTTWFWPPPTGPEVASHERELLSSLSAATATRTHEGMLFRGWRPEPNAIVDESGIDRVLDFLDRSLGGRE